MSVHSEPQICLGELSRLPTEAVILQKLLQLIREQIVPLSEGLYLLYFLISSAVERESMQLHSLYGYRETTKLLARVQLKTTQSQKLGGRKREQISHWDLKETKEERKIFGVGSGC